MAEYVISRWMAASPVRVFEAISTPQGLAAWIGPDSGPVLVAETDLRIGGRYRLRFRTEDGAEFEASGTYLLIDPTSALSMTWTWHGRDEPSSTLEFRLEDEAGGTRLTLRQRTDDRGAARRDRTGWTRALQKLVAQMGGAGMTEGDRTAETDVRSELYHQLHGRSSDRPPLLLIHGGGSTIESNWSALLPEVESTRQVIAVELQGHGRSPALDREPSFVASADDLAALLDRLGLGPVDVLGFSNGGTTALRLAQRHPAHVRRQIVASAIATRDGMLDGFWDGMEAATPDALPAEYRRADLDATGDPAHADVLFRTDRDQMLGFTDFRLDELARIPAPTLFVVGDRDVVTVEHTTWMTGHVAGSRLLVVPAGHGEYLGEVLASGGDVAAMRATLPWLLDFLDR